MMQEATPNTDSNKTIQTSTQIYLIQLDPKHVIASNAQYPSTETRNPSWVKELRNAGIQLSLLNETGGITMTKKDNRIQLQTTR